MVLMLDELAAITRVHPDFVARNARGSDGATQGPARLPTSPRCAGGGDGVGLARTLERLGFGAGFATPRYSAPRPSWPSRRRDSVASEWHPL